MILGPDGKPLPPGDLKEKMEAMQNMMAEVQTVLVARKADINDQTSVAINLIVQAFRHVPYPNEMEYVKQTIAYLGQALEQAAVQKFKDRQDMARASKPSTLQ